MKTAILSLSCLLAGIFIGYAMWEPIAAGNAETTRLVLQDERQMMDCTASRMEAELLYSKQIDALKSGGPAKTFANRQEVGAYWDKN